eukprot:m51a1_g6612 hypothetical protein (195) ;mRNA; r:21948-22590
MNTARLSGMAELSPARVQELAQSLMQARRENAELKEQLHERDWEIAGLRAQAAQRASELDRARKDVELLQEISRVQEERISTVTDKWRTMRETFKQLASDQADMQAMHEEKLRLQHHLASLQEQIKSQTAVAGQLKAQLDIVACARALQQRSAAGGPRGGGGLLPTPTPFLAPQWAWNCVPGFPVCPLAPPSGK